MIDDLLGLVDDRPHQLLRAQDAPLHEDGAEPLAGSHRGARVRELAQGDDGPPHEQRPQAVIGIGGSGEDELALPHRDRHLSVAAGEDHFSRPIPELELVDEVGQVLLGEAAADREGGVVCLH